MLATKIVLERKIAFINNWLKHHPKTHFAYNQKKQNHSYYMGKRCDMDDLGSKTIKI